MNMIKSMMLGALLCTGITGVSAGSYDDLSQSVGRSQAVQYELRQLRLLEAGESVEQRSYQERPYGQQYGAYPSYAQPQFG